MHLSKPVRPMLRQIWMQWVLRCSEHPVCKPPFWYEIIAIFQIEIKSKSCHVHVATSRTRNTWKDKRCSPTVSVAMHAFVMNTLTTRALFTIQIVKRLNATSKFIMQTVWWLDAFRSTMENRIVAQSIGDAVSDKKHVHFSVGLTSGYVVLALNFSSFYFQPNQKTKLFRAHTRLQSTTQRWCANLVHSSWESVIKSNRSHKNIVSSAAVLSHRWCIAYKTVIARRCSLVVSKYNLRCSLVASNRIFQQMNEMSSNCSSTFLIYELNSKNTIIYTNNKILVSFYGFPLHLEIQCFAWNKTKCFVWNQTEDTIRALFENPVLPAFYQTKKKKKNNNMEIADYLHNLPMLLHAISLLYATMLIDCSVDK